ncbi:MAG: hypothetical protein KC636_40120, partial [Myxococcales bacterium]|nr:hypothetical protein [Myxococcales bacterium]
MEERTAQARVRRAARVRPRERPRSESSPEPVPEPRVEPAPQPAAPRRRLPAVEGLAMVIGGLLAFGMIGDAYRDSVGQAPTVIPGLVIEGVEVGGLTREALLAREAELSERGLSRVITLAGPGGVAIETTARDLGAVPAFTEAVDEALA